MNLQFSKREVVVGFAMMLAGFAIGAIVFFVGLSFSKPQSQIF